MAAPDAITIVQLSRLIGTPDAPIILDVRIPDDRAAEARDRWARDAVNETHNWPAATGPRA